MSNRVAHPHLPCYRHTLLCNSFIRQFCEAKKGWLVAQHTLSTEGEGELTHSTFPESLSLPNLMRMAAL